MICQQSINYIKGINKNPLLLKQATGVVFGTQKNRFVTKPETQDGHVLVIGGAGSGKSACVAIPSLMSWRERVFAIDVKGELFQKTREKRNNIKVFNPSDEEAFGFDPFYILKESKNLGTDMKSLVMDIIPLPPNEENPFWIESAWNFLTGALLNYYELGFTFIQAVEMIQTTPPKDTLMYVNKIGSKLARMYMTQFIGLSEKTLLGIFIEVSNKIMVFATDDKLRKALSKTDIITPQMLEEGADIYLCLEESKLEQWKGLVTMMINQFLKHFERRTNGQATPVLFLLDEFSRLGKIEAIKNSLAILKNNKITITFIINSLAAIDSVYGEENTQAIIDSCEYKAIFNLYGLRERAYFSEIVRSYTAEIRPQKISTQLEFFLITPYGFYRVKKTPYYLTKETVLNGMDE